MKDTPADGHPWHSLEGQLQHIVSGNALPLVITCSLLVLFLSLVTVVFEGDSY